MDGEGCLKTDVDDIVDVVVGEGPALAFSQSPVDVAVTVRGQLTEGAADGEEGAGGLAVIVPSGLRPGGPGQEPDLGVELRTLALVLGLDTDGACPAIRTGELLGRVPSASKVTYATEAALFHAVGIQTIGCGRGDMHRAHTANEFVELDQIRACGAVDGILERALHVPATVHSAQE